jgi:dTDP-4-dehydrorhamnose 3,5-epimerase
MIEGATRDTQSVTPRWDPVQWNLIPGVKVFETKNVLTGYGRLVEIYREDWGLDDEPVRQVFQSTLNPGEGSAWHAHGDTRDRLFVNSGTMRIVLYDHPTGLVNVFTLGEHRPGLVVIPKGVWHGILNVGPGESSVINLVSHEYSYADPDHWKLPADTDKIDCDAFRHLVRAHLPSQKTLRSKQ